MNRVAHACGGRSSHGSGGTVLVDRNDFFHRHRGRSRELYRRAGNAGGTGRGMASRPRCLIDGVTELIEARTQSQPKVSEAPQKYTNRPVGPPPTAVYKPTASSTVSVIGVPDGKRDRAGSDHVRLRRRKTSSKIDPRRTRSRKDGDGFFARSVPIGFRIRRNALAGHSDFVSGLKYGGPRSLLHLRHEILIVKHTFVLVKQLEHCDANHQCD